MTEGAGLRQRKKERTRRLLVDTALRLFQEQGYEQTTIAQIAETAELSPGTFFLHFATKEDVVFAGQHDRLDLALLAIRERSPDEAPVEVLVHVIERVAVSVRESLNIATESGRLRIGLLLSVPALKAQALHRIAEAQRQVAAALRTAYPDQLDAVAAAAMVGALSGATVAAAIAAVEAGMDGEQTKRAVLDSLNTTARGFRQRT